MNTSHRVFISQGAAVTPLGFSINDNFKAVSQKQSAIREINDPFIDSTPFFGSVIDKKKLNNHFNQLNYSGSFSELEKMMLLAVHKISSAYQSLIGERCGLIISSTKGNILSLEQNEDAEYYLHRLTNKIAKQIGISQQPIVISNACVSGIMAVSVAKRLIQTEQFDHFIVIGGDIFSRFVFSGFQAFQAISSFPCKPYDKMRDGITLGEAAASVFITSDIETAKENSFFEIKGDSSINDANHISGPSRTGEGLYLSISKALQHSNITADKIDFISSHGTATLYNDEMEAQAFHRTFLEKTPIASLKGYFGHTLGAAGLLETVISLKFAEKNTLPVSLGYSSHGLTLPLAIITESKRKEINYFLKSASGFGGSNTAIVFKKIKNNEY